VRLGSGPNDARRDTQSEGLPDAPHSDPERQSSTGICGTACPQRRYHDISSTRLSHGFLSFLPPQRASLVCGTSEKERHSRLRRGLLLSPSCPTIPREISMRDDKHKRGAARSQQSCRRRARMKFNTSQKSTGSPAIKPNVSSNAWAITGKSLTRLPPN
jgi:hypothetical protein